MIARVIIKRKPGAGRKRKISQDHVIDILNSKQKINYLASQYKVSKDTIYKVFVREKIKNMNIPVTPEDEEMHEHIGSYELCIFCNEATKFWHEATNRPVCPLCSVVNKVSDIPNAPYGY